MFIASEDVSRDEMRRASEAWLSAGRLAAIGWYEAMERGQVPAFEATVRNEGLTQFRVFERSENAASTPREPVIVMRFVEPMRGNASALGLNVLSIPAARAAIERSRAEAVSVASAPFALTQIPEGQDRTGVVVYRAVAFGEGLGDARTRGPLPCAPFVTLRPGPLLAAMAGDLPPHLSRAWV